MYETPVGSKGVLADAADQALRDAKAKR